MESFAQAMRLVEVVEPHHRHHRPEVSSRTIAMSWRQSAMTVAG